MSTRWQASTGSILTEFSLGAHIHILLLHGGRVGVQQRTVVNGEKGHSRQLTVQVLHIKTQITASSIYADLGQVALCVAP